MEKETSDQELIAAAKENQNAFGALYEKYLGSVYRYLWKRVGKSKEIAEDLVQETFLRAFSSLPRITAQYSSYLGYLMKIAKNLLISYYRKKKPITMQTLPDIPVEIKSKIESSFDATLLLEKMSFLRPDEEKALLLRYRDGMKIAHVARELSRSENATKLLLSRARKKLKKRLEK